MNTLSNGIKNIIQLINTKKSTQREINKSNQLVNSGYKINNITQKRNVYQKAVFLNPHNGNALVQLGLIEMNNPNKINQYLGFYLLEKAFDSHFAKPCIPIDSFQGEYLAKIIARYNYEHKYFKKAKYFFRLANLSKAKMDHVSDVQLATFITGYPKSITDAKSIVDEYNYRMDRLLKMNHINMKSAYEDNDPYNFSILSAFNIESYYESDFKSMMNKNYKLITKIFPELIYKYPSLNSKPINKTKYKIGIASGFFYKNNSVLADFKGVMDRLSRDKFDITFIYLKELYLNDSEYLKNKKSIIIDTKNDKHWLTNARQKIGSQHFDLILYLDSTMSSVCHRILMSKLARVQAVSHGHPVTSGVDQEYMDYYISWGAAELDYKIAKQHYTEKLILLRKHEMHQYYENRISKQGLSTINNLPFKHMTRNDFKEFVPSDGNWYVCMQKPFKIHPIFDGMLKNILEQDKKGRIILHDGINEEIMLTIRNRLKQTNMDMNRVHFIPCQPHNKLLALYNLSDVVLDSYYAGGCTTTREVLELGVPVVTLPGKYLGGRWSLAYYNIIGIPDMIAKNKEDYVNIAVNIGSNKKERMKHKTNILKNIHKLFRKEEAVKSWEQVLEHIITV